MREDGTYDATEARERLVAVDNEVADLAAAAPKRQTLADLNLDELVEAARWFVQRLSDIWTTLDGSSRSRFERLAFPDGFSYQAPRTIRTPVPGLIFALVRSLPTAVSLAVGRDGFSSNPEEEYNYFCDLIEFYRDFGPAESLWKQQAGGKRKAA